MQCDQIWRFFKVLGDKFAYKSSQKRLLTFGLVWKRAINVKITVNIFGNLLKHLGNCFTPTYGHTDVMMNRTHEKQDRVWPWTSLINRLHIDQSRM